MLTTATLAGWTRDHVVHDVRIAVNVSGRHLADGSLVDDVRAALRASGLPAHHLTIEVTESVLADRATITGQLAVLRDLGVRVVIDDFGTGYTSLGQLAYLDADTLKIDRSLVATDSPGSRELLHLLIHAAHAHGLSVTAEGVEHPDQLNALTEAGCDHAQGHLLGRPAPAHALAEGQRTSSPGPQPFPLPRTPDHRS